MTQETSNKDGHLDVDEIQWPNDNDQKIREDSLVEYIELDQFPRPKLLWESKSVSSIINYIIL